MEDKKNWWVSGVGLVSDISAWIVAPVVLALIFGKMLDGRYGTEPTLFLVCFGAGFLITIYGIWQRIKKYRKNLE